MRTKLALPVREPRNTLQMDGFHYRPRAGAIAIIGQRHLEAETVVPKRLGRVDVVEEVRNRHAEPTLAEVAPDAMGRGVRRTRGVGADFAWHRAENGAIGVERDELSEAGGSGARPGADDGAGRPCFPCSSLASCRS